MRVEYQTRSPKIQIVKNGPNGLVSTHQTIVGELPILTTVIEGELLLQII